MSRRPTAEQVAAWPFAARLGDEERGRVAFDVELRKLAAGTVVCHKGMRASTWIGVLAGAVKIEATAPDGRSTTLATMPTGSWFGEGSVLKEERGWPYEALMLQAGEVALMPAATFRWLIDTSLPFNHYIIDHLNARLGQFIERCEHERLYQADQHIAHCIVELLDRELYPDSSPQVVLSQEELARLAGASRTVVNRVLHRLESMGVVGMSYGAIRLLDPARLRRFSETAV
jgi:CRP/FNR family cyclic AMP-dependent transcriptional regulator